MRPRRPVLPHLLALGLATAAGLASCSDSRASEPRFEFVDVASDAGIQLRNRSGDPRRWYIPESNGCGAAFLDHDTDGDQDLFVANGAGMRYIDDGARLEVLHDATSRLYENEGDLVFRDATLETKAGRSEWINGLATGDVDDDGDPDLFLACFGEDVLLWNEDGEFRDATAEAGVRSSLWGAAASFGDADNDGDLDLYVANYCLFDPAAPPLGGKRADIDGVQIAWGPEEENGQGANAGSPDRFYLGDGEGGFLESTSPTGLALEKALCSYAVVFSDVDGDGWQDILVANDLQPSNLFHNKGTDAAGLVHFAEEGVERGFAFNGEGKATGAMGLATDDFDQDGDIDVFRTNFDFEANALHVNDGGGRFTDRAATHGLAAPSVDRLGWACAFLDADLDGDLDLLVANGHVFPQAEEIGMSPWEQYSQLFEARADETGRIVYTDATALAGAGLALARSARGAAFGDLDDDGDVDVVLVDLDGPPRVLENRTERRGRWIAVRLVGSVSNRDGYGARVSVHAGGSTWVREMKTTQGLYSANDPRLHFGLGEVAAIERLEVRWPSGNVSLLRRPDLDGLVTIYEPEDEEGEPER